MRRSTLWLLALGAALAAGCAEEEGVADDDAAAEDDDAADDDSAPGDDDSGPGDDDSGPGDDDTAPGDDDTADDDTADDDTSSDDDTATGSDDDTLADDDASDDDAADDDSAPAESCVTRPPPVYDPDTTVTIHLHGWILDGPTDEEQYGTDTGGGPHADGVRLYTGFPDGTVDPYAPNQVVGSSYYGSIPPDWYSADDVAEVEALWGVPRYALVIAKQARNILARVPEATGVAFTCESMGCEVVRYLLENDVDGLVTDGLAARWATYAGVVAGAGLAETGYLLAEYAEMIGLDLVDVDHMSYDWYETWVAACDHQRLEGNNPAFAGMPIHHVVATRPTFEEAWDLPLLDLFNLEALPNDGIMWSEDEWFHAMADEARLVTPAGERLASSRTHSWTDHFSTRDSDGAHAVGAALLVGSRRVEVTLDALTLLDDLEADDAFDFADTGSPPAEVVIETEVRWPWLTEAFGRDPVIDVRRMSDRVVPVHAMEEGDTLAPGEVIAEMPVFDEMDAVRLTLTALEADWYPTVDVFENLFDADEWMGAATLDLPIADGTHAVDLGAVQATLSVRVYTLY